MQCSTPVVWRPWRVIGVLILVLLQGCQFVSQTTQPGFDTQQSARDANSALRMLNPPGTGYVEALSNMERAGFQCQPLATADGGYNKSVLCHVSTSRKQAATTSPLASVNWLVALDFRDGQTLGSLQASRRPQDLEH